MGPSQKHVDIQQLSPSSKQAQDSSNLQNYRPITLTSTLRKTMGRLVGNRLTCYQESNGLITSMQTVKREEP